MALNGLFCADVLLRNYSLTHSPISTGVTDNMTQVRPATDNLYIITTNEETYIINTTTVGSILTRHLDFAGIENNIKVAGILVTHS